MKTTAFDLQLNPAHPGLRLHKLDRARDPNFWSVRVSRNVRIIVHRTQNSLMLCYVDHHDNAYQWAERRRLETHSKTGAAQLNEVRETVQEVVVPLYAEAEQETPPKPSLSPTFPKTISWATGYRPEWLNDVCSANEDSLLGLVDHLPSERRLLELAVGGTHSWCSRLPLPTRSSIQTRKRRFLLVNDTEELERALEYPWEKWALFLHPGSAAARREGLQRSVSCVRCGRYGQDRRGDPPSGVPRTRQFRACPAQSSAAASDWPTARAAYSSAMRFPPSTRRPGEFTEEAGLTRWYFYDLDREAILEEPGEIVANIRSRPNTPRRCTTEEKTFIEVRTKIERHIKNTYLKRIDAPAGVKPSLKCWMDLNEG